MKKTVFARIIIPLLTISTHAIRAIEDGDNNDREMTASIDFTMFNFYHNVVNQKPDDMPAHYNRMILAQRLEHVDAGFRAIISHDAQWILTHQAHVHAYAYYVARSTREPLEIYQKKWQQILNAAQRMLSNH